VDAVVAWARSGSRWTRVWLAIFTGVAGAIGMFAVAGWSRTRSAFPQFERFSPSADVAVSDDSPTPDDPALFQQIASAAGATASRMIANVPVTLSRPDGTTVSVGVVASPVPAVGSVDRGLLVSGRLADPSRSDELTMNEAAAAEFHVHAGSRIDVGLFARSQTATSAPGEPAPLLGRVPMTVAGIVRYTADLEQQPNTELGTDFATANERIFLSDGFWAAYGSRVATDFMGMALNLPDRAAGFGHLANVTTELSAGRFTPSLGDNFVANRAALVRTIDLQAAAFFAVGLLGALAGAVLIAQAIARNVAFRATDHRILAILGMTRPRIMASEVLSAVPAALGALVVALTIAVGLSPLTPIGVSRDAELHPGLEFNWLVLAIGAVGVVAFVLGVTAIAAWASGRVRSESVRRHSWLSARLAAAGAPPPIITGAEFALSRTGRATAAIRPALAGLVVGLIVVVGASVVQSSLTTLLNTPARRGWAWDAEVGNFTSPQSAADGARALDQDPDVAGYAGQLGGIFVPIDGHPTPVTVLDPHGDVAGPIILDGRAPVAADEIALGRQTLTALHKHVGDLVSVTSPQGQVLELRIVGTAVPASAIDALESFGKGALIPFALVQQTTDPDQVPTPSAYVVSFRPGTDRQAALARLQNLFPRTVLVAPSSVDVDTLRRVNWMPVALAVLVGVLTVGTFAHVVLTSARRRRRDFGVLRAIGFTNRQVGAVVMAMAASVSVVVLVIGVPLGLAAGRVAWRVIGDGLGTDAGVDLPAWLAILVPTTVVIAVLTALVPAWQTVRQRPAAALRQD
jgi:hypothetical protein